MLRAELDLAIQALKNEQRRLELIEKYKHAGTMLKGNETHEETRNIIIENMNWCNRCIALKECEASDE